MITTFKLFENVKNKFSYYCLDWDDNILVMPTVIHLDKLVDGEWVPYDPSTAEYAIIRNDKVNYRLRNNNPREAYYEFRDYGPRGTKAFYLDAMEAIKRKSFGPSWDSFINCIVGGNLFMIITTRGHAPDTMRRVVEWIIYNYLTDEQQDEMLQNLMKYHEIFGEDIDYLVDQYLDNCEFIGVMSDFFKEKFGEVASIEEGKELAVKYFKDKLVNFVKQVDGDMSIGFSDDDLKFVSHIQEFMKKEKKLDFLLDVDYYVFNTNDPKNVKKTKI